MKKNSIFTILVISIITRSFSFSQDIDINGPSGSGVFGHYVTVLPNGNFVINDPYYDEAGILDIGAVYLYDGETKTIISVMKGSKSGDKIGTRIFVLKNGNYIVLSDYWKNDNNDPVGAMTWCSSIVGLSGLVSSTNSLIGSTAYDLQNAIVTSLNNGNYVVQSRAWDNGSLVNAGAITWCDGTIGRTGIISDVISLVGSSSYDNVGSNDIIELINGNYIVSTPTWDNAGIIDAGAVTWCDGSVGRTGYITEINSLVGSSPYDFVGSIHSGVSAVIPLNNGNYVVPSSNWDDGIKVDVGAVTWCDGTVGRSGTINITNSLVGSTQYDKLAFSMGLGLVALDNGNYVIGSEKWSNELGIITGAVTWGNGSNGIFGYVSSSNSLVFSSNNDMSSAKITALANGNYVVSCPLWDNIVTAPDVGAVIWCDGTTGRIGVVSENISLVGSIYDDQVGINVYALKNGNYVVTSVYWNNGSTINTGAVTWCNGSTGMTGVVSASNSLVGSTAWDLVGFKVYELSNQNYVVGSSFWDRGSIADAGAVTWCNGMTGRTGIVSSANSLVGTTAYDFVGADGSDRGGVYMLSNGNYSVTSTTWDNGSIADAGAVTWCNGTTGRTGIVSSANSLIGSTNGDEIGNLGILSLNNGNYVALSSKWSDGLNLNVGAVTWCNGTSGRIGTVSLTNSLIGSTTNDLTSIVTRTYNNGNYTILSSNYDNGTIVDAGAATLCNGISGTYGIISSCNSVLGDFELDIRYHNDYLSGAFYNEIKDYIIVTRINQNRITISNNLNLTASVTIISSDDDNSICSGENVTFSAIAVNGGTSPVYQWKINGINVVGQTSSNFTTNSLVNNDIVTCELTSSEACVTSPTALSTGITTIVIPLLTPLLSIASNDPDNSICDGSIITFSALPTNGGSTPSYQWKLNGANVGSNSETFTINTLATNDLITCEMISNATCASPTTVGSLGITMTVNSYETPSLNIISDDLDNTICNGSSVTFTANPTVGGTMPIYDWKINGTSVGSGSSFTSNSLNNNDVISCVLASNEACISTPNATSNNITISVTNTVTPNVVITSNDIDNTICTGTSTTFSTSPTNGGTSPTYDWKLNGTIVANGSSYTNASLANGDIITCEITSNAVCPSPINATSNSISMIVNAKPTISSSSGLTFCQGQSISLTSSENANNSWSTGATSNSIVVATSGTYNVSNLLTGCTSNNVAVTVNPIPTTAVISASGSTTICTGGNVILSSDLSSGNVWSTGATSQSITVSSAGNYSVTTTLGSCTASSNVISVSITSSPTIALGSVSPTSSCGGSDGTIQINGSGSGTISWTGTTSGTQNVILPILLQNFGVGAYNVTYANANGCNSNTVSATVSSPASPSTPSISASGVTTFCQGGSVVLNSSASTGNVWSNGATSQSITVNQSGTYTTVVSSAPGCDEISNEIIVTVIPTPVTPVITASGATTFCQGGSVVLSSSVTSGNSWTGGGTAQDITVNSSGTYVVNVTENGCVSANSTPIMVTVNPIPAAPFLSASGPTTFCAGESVTLSSDVTSGIVWSPNGETSASITTSEAGTYFVTVLVNGCSNTSGSVTTSVNPVPTPSIASVADVCDTADVIILNQGSPAGGVYTVNGTTATSFTPNAGNVGVNLLEYSLTQNNCTGTATTSITVLDCSTGVGLTENTLTFKLFPNPTTGIIEISGIPSEEITSIKVYDQVGKLILTDKQINKINLTSFARGIYTVHLKTSRFETQHKIELIK